MSRVPPTAVEKKVREREHVRCGGCAILPCCISRFGSDWFALAASRDGEGKRTGTTRARKARFSISSIFYRVSRSLTRSFIREIRKFRPDIQSLEAISGM